MKKMSLVVLFSLFVSIVAMPSFDSREPSESTKLVERVKLFRNMYASTGNPDYVEEVFKAIRSQDREAVFEGLFSLQQLAPKWRDKLGDSVIREVGPLLKEEDAFLLHSATATLVSYGEFALPVLEDLLIIMRRDASGAAVNAADAIAELGLAANSAQVDLVEALSASVPTRESAIRALDRIGALRPESLRRIRECTQMTDQSWTFRLNAAKVLLRRDPGDADAVNVVALALRTPLSTVRLLALSVLEEIGLIAQPWGKGLVESVATSDGDATVRAAAAAMLRPSSQP